MAKPKNLKVESAITESDTKQEIHADNSDIASGQFLHPFLAQDTSKITPARKYPSDMYKAEESEFTKFKRNTDFSIPVAVTITKIIRITTMNNEEQALGEYVYYTANIQGFQKTYVEGKLETYPHPDALVTDVHFGMYQRITLQPIFENGVKKGYADKGEYRYYTTKFTKESIDKILNNTTQEEGVRVEYTLIDTGITYGGFTKEELEGCKLNRLVFRNTNKLNGTEILEEDKLK